MITTSTPPLSTSLPATGPRTMWGYCRGADTKHKAAAFDRSLIEQIPIPVTTNGAIITGKLPDGSTNRFKSGPKILPPVPCDKNNPFLFRSFLGAALAL